MEYNGEYGGKVLHPFKGMGTTFIRGAILSAEDVKDWPLRNRRALHEAGTIEWYGPPNPEESAARESGAETKTVSKPAKLKAEQTKEEAKPAKDAVKTTRRRGRTK